MIEKKFKRIKRHKRLRAKVKGIANTPRLCVFRSNKYIYAQLIDDTKGKTIVSTKNTDIKEIKKSKIRKTDAAFNAGLIFAKKALEKSVNKVVFDRGGFKYHGRVKAFADGAKKGGLQF